MTDLIAEDGQTVCEEEALALIRRGRALFRFPLFDARPLARRIDKTEFSLWRYRAVLPIPTTGDSWRSITMGEGATPLVDAGNRWPDLKFKVDYTMPTLSFKDRGAAVMIAKAMDWNIAHVAIDSSGNAGTAVAAYSARAGIGCDVFVPAAASPSKLVQMARHGATVHRIEGPRESAAVAARQFVDESGAFYASHVYNPWFYEGTKTFAYELWEQLDSSTPNNLYLPAGNGTLVLGAYKGFAELLGAGLIRKLPVIHATQSDACAPLARAFARGGHRTEPVPNHRTVAEGVAIADPPRGPEIFRAVYETGGTVLTVSDEEVLRAQAELAQAGFFVEPTSAIAFAAYKRRQATATGSTGLSVVPLCGAGLKTSTEAA